MQPLQSVIDVNTLNTLPVVPQGVVDHWEFSVRVFRVPHPTGGGQSYLYELLGCSAADAGRVHQSVSTEQEATKSVVE